MAPKRKYGSAYIKYGFTENKANREMRFRSVICTVVLCVDDLKLAFAYHIHPILLDRPPEFFDRKCKTLELENEAGTK